MNLGNLSLDKLSQSSSFLYCEIMSYSHSKLCNALHVLELSKRLASRGIEVFAVHPGSFIPTGITKPNCLYRALVILFRPLTKTLVNLLFI